MAQVPVQRARHVGLWHHRDCQSHLGDGGRTWGDERILVRPDLAEDLSVQAPALRRLESGDLLLMCLHSHRADGEGELGGSSSSMELFRSCDEGQTFDSVGYLWRRSPGQWLQGGASSLLQLASGRLLVPFHYGTGWQGSQHNRVSCMLSDDEGNTWRKTEADIDLPMRGAMEASVAELPDGELVLSLRTQLGAVFLRARLTAASTGACRRRRGCARPSRAPACAPCPARTI